MNYRHIYHAGNFADVFKHCVLIMLMQSLSQKDKPISYLDTHAGIGKYDLTSENAQKTLEYKDGIGRLYQHLNEVDLPDLIGDYLQIVQASNNSLSDKMVTDFPDFYPGSPRIISALMRPQDSMVLVEKHPEDLLELKREFRRDSHVAVHYLDGYQSMKAFLPPKKGRGLILIDPAYEEKDELQQIITAMQMALNRFSIGVYAIWFPIKERLVIERFYDELRQLAAQNVLIAELSVSERGIDVGVDCEGGLTSCGMAIINAPWRFKEQLNPIMVCLSRILAIDPTGKYDLRYYSDMD